VTDDVDVEQAKNPAQGLSFYKLWQTLGDLLEKTYRAFHRSQRLGERFKEMDEEFDKEAAAVEIRKELEERIREVLAEHDDLGWDDAIQLVLDETQLDHVRAEKEKAKKKSGDFTGVGEDDEA
jgi:hypothetical protein